MVEVINRYSNQDKAIEPLKRIIQYQPGIGNPEEPRRTRQIQKRLSHKEMQEAIRRYQAGETARTIGAALGVNRKTVLALLKRQRVSTRYNLLSAEDISLASQLYADGASLAQLGQQFGVDRGTVRRALLKAGLKIGQR